MVLHTCGLPVPAPDPAEATGMGEAGAGVHAEGPGLSQLPGGVEKGHRMERSEQGWEMFSWMRLAGSKDKQLPTGVGIQAPQSSHRRVHAAPRMEAGRGGCFKPPDRGFH